MQKIKKLSVEVVMVSDAKLSKKAQFMRAPKSIMTLAILNVAVMIGISVLAWQSYVISPMILVVPPLVALILGSEIWSMVTRTYPTKADIDAHNRKIIAELQDSELQDS